MVSRLIKIKEKKQMYTVNGLTEKKEREILRREKEAIAAYKKSKLKPLTAEELIRELES